MFLTSLCNHLVPYKPVCLDTGHAPLVPRSVCISMFFESIIDSTELAAAAELGSEHSSC